MNRTELLKSYIERLNKGEDLETVQKDFTDNFADVDASEIVNAEQEMINQGTPVEEVQRLCDVHSALFHGDTIEERIMAAEEAVRASHPASAMRDADLSDEEGHPLMILTLENQIFMNLLNGTERKLTNDEDIQEELMSLGQIGKHYDKKDELLLPTLKRLGIPGPSDVMWNVDVELRRSLKDVTKSKDKNETLALIQRFREMVFKEEKILFPMCEKRFTMLDWQVIHSDFPRFGYAWLEAVPAWPYEMHQEINANVKVDNTSAQDAIITLPTGTFTLAQLEAVLNTLPMELTFIDENNISRYFSLDSSIFPRPLSALGKPVYACHPPMVIPMVKNVIDTLKSGKKKVVSFVAPKKGRKAYVRYMRVENQNHEFLGILEVVEDVTDLKL